MILDEIIADVRRGLAARGAHGDRRGLPARTRPLELGAFRSALAVPGVAVIAEIKRASPSRRTIRADFRPAEHAVAYARAGAAAVSCLTEPRWFGGSLDDLAAAGAAIAIPLLRKDFIVDERQLDEAVAYGADAVLLIAAAVKRRALGALFAGARQRQLDALVECHTPAEADQALDIGAEIIGINNRDLHTMNVDLRTTERVLETIRARVGASGRMPVVVSESGIRTADDVRRVAELGVDAVLVGEALMASSDLEDATRQLVEAGRAP